MALTEVLRFLVEADTTKAQANLKALTDKAKEVERLEATMLRLRDTAGKSGSQVDLQKFNAAVAAAGKAKAELNGLSAAAAAPIPKITKLGEALQLGLAGGIGIEAVQGLVQGISRLVSFAADQAGKAVSEAASLEQSAASVGIVFGNAAGQVEAFGRGAADSVGLSKDAFNQAAVSIGNLLNAAGFAQDEVAKLSINLVQLAADLGAVANVSTQQATLGISALLRGEFDTAEKLGVSIKQSSVDARVAALGFDVSTDALRRQARARASLLILEEQSANKRGAFAARETTYLNQQQRFNAELANARAELGQALLPALVQLVQLAREVTPVIAAIGPALKSMGDQARSAAEALARIAIGPVKTDGMLSLKNILIGVGLQIPGVNLFIKELKKSIDEMQKQAAVRDAWDKFAAAIRDGNTPLSELLNYIRLLPENLQRTALKLLGIGDAAAKAAIGIRDLSVVTAELAGLNDSLFGISDRMDRFRDAVSSGKASDDSAAAAKRQRDALRGVDNATRSLTDAQEALNEALVNRFLVSLGATSDEVTEAQIDERNATRSLASAKLDLIDAEERLNRLRNGGARASRLEAQAAFIEAQRAFAEAQASGDAVAIARARAQVARAQEGLQDTSGSAQQRQDERAQLELAAATDKVTQSGIDQRKAQQELLDTINRGKEGSKELAAANKEVEDASRRVQDAQQALADAQEAVQAALEKTAASGKSLADRFKDGRSSAQDLLDYLVKNKKGPADFADAIGLIESELGAVSKELGNTKEYDAYIGKVKDLVNEYLRLEGFAKVLSDVAPKGILGQRGSIGAETGVTQELRVEIDGQLLGKVLVTESERSNGLPIRIRVG